MKRVFIKIFRVIFYPLIVIFSLLYKLYRWLNGKKTAIIYSDILNGFTNYTFPSLLVENITKRRASICATCPLAKYSGIVNTITNGEKVVEIKGMYCEACGCPLSTKLRDPASSCPQNRW